MFSRRMLLASPAFLAACAADPSGEADPEMEALLRTFASLHPLPIETLTPADARKQPSLADAVKAQLRNAGRPVEPRPVARAMDVAIPMPVGGPLLARIYTPVGAAGPLPLIVYFHGGGWVIADLDTYDSSARALAAETGAVVLSVHYRQGPEFRFPSAHDDAINAWRWATANRSALGADPYRAAVVGESAGASLALNVGIAARDLRLPLPVAMGIIYPVAGTDTETPSYDRYAGAKPLNRPMINWFVRNYTNSPRDLEDPRLALYERANLAGLPPALIINAQIDPLQDDGARLEVAMRRQGTLVRRTVYPGVTHEFFGADAVLTKARAAQQEMGGFLRAAFAAMPAPVEAPAMPTRRRR
ncbi:MAG: alpha/beta hydrolase [Rubritepida sp.]|nr:alpha/beta hydrolase [Rubritepida sp.]